MKKSKMVIFLVRGKAVEEIEGDDIDLHGVECMKTNIAIMHGVSFEDVEVDTKDFTLPELSTSLAVSDKGELVFKAGINAVFVSAKGISPSLDITKEDLLYEFLDLITKRDYDNALIFRNLI